MRIDEWQQLASHDLFDVDPESTIALLPVAATEQHKPHLPLGIDAPIGQGIIGALPRDGDEVPRVLLLPLLAVGDSLEHQAFPGNSGHRGRNSHRRLDGACRRRWRGRMKCWVWSRVSAH